MTTTDYGKSDYDKSYSYDDDDDDDDDYSSCCLQHFLCRAVHPFSGRRKLPGASELARFGVALGPHRALWLWGL